MPNIHWKRLDNLIPANFQAHSVDLTVAVVVTICRIAVRAGAIDTSNDCEDLLVYATQNHNVVRQDGNNPLHHRLPGHRIRCREYTQLPVMPP